MSYYNWTMEGTNYIAVDRAGRAWGTLHKIEDTGSIIFTSYEKHAEHEQMN